MGVPKVDSGSGSAYGGPDTAQDPVATVQAGETTLSQVAHRLGLDPKSLLDVNPQIKDPAHLKAGQDINLPQSAAGDTLDSSLGAPASTLLGSPSGSSPQGSSDPMAKTMVQMRLGASPAKGTAGHLHEQRINDLVSDPGAAHQAWKNLSPSGSRGRSRQDESPLRKSFCRPVFGSSHERQGAARNTELPARNWADIGRTQGQGLSPGKQGARQSRI